MVRRHRDWPKSATRVTATTWNKALTSARLLEMRKGASYNEVNRAVVKTINATFDRSKWMELGLETGTLDYIQNHGRLLRSLSWGDDDYLACVIEAVPVVLAGNGRRGSPRERLKNLGVVEKYLGLPVWLKEHEPQLYQDLYAGEDETVLDELQEAAKSLGIEDVDAHAARIRRGLHDDPEQAIGSAKELLESVLKAILGLHGNGPETKIEIPKLAKDASERLGLHPGEHRDHDPGANQRRRLFTSLNNIVILTAELRNAGFGTGHGGSQRPALDLATARLVVSSAVTVATFYMEVFAADEES